MRLLYGQTKQGEVEPMDPSPLVGLRQEIGKLLEGFMREPFEGIPWPFRAQGKWSPPVEIVDSDDAILIRLELPGVDPAGVDVTVNEGRLVIVGDKPQPERPGAGEVCRCEMRYGAFRRSIPLPDEIDIEGIDASCRHGVLSLRVPKQRAAAAQKVHVKVAT